MSVILGYLCATLFGLVLLVASWVAAGHGDDADGFDGHGGHDGHDGSSDVGDGAPGGVIGGLGLQLLSLRFWTYLCTFGGAAGLTVRWLGLAGWPLAEIVALFVGCSAALMARLILHHAGRQVRTGLVRLPDCVGRVGSVVVPFGPGVTGKVRIRVAGGEIDVLAMSECEEVGCHDEVVVLEVRGETAWVVRQPTVDDSQ